ncbi:MAG TPA: hypothetical protein PKK26_17275 [Candidatus Wallbacteria bacterium]|nr:hypothetical protein [Candidatus Wallbacteria bacterium]
MNLIYMILRMLSVLGEKAKNSEIMDSKIWSPRYSAVKRMTHNVKMTIEKPATMIKGFYKSMKRCV